MYITILVKQVYLFISQVSGERLQDHWSSGYLIMVRIIIYVVIHLIDKFKYLSWKAGLYDIECYKTNNIEKVQVGNDQENAQSERNFHSESRGTDN